MKKILLLVAVMAVSYVSVNAQEKLRWGVVAGINMSDVDYSSSKSKIGFHTGVKVEIGLPQLTDGLYLDVATLLSLKGAKFNLGGGSVTLNPYYLEVPVHLGYKFTVGDNLSLFVSGGPYFAYGLFGKANSKDDEDMDLFDSDEEIMERFDAGLGLKIGFEINKNIQISLGYDYGLLNIVKNDVEDIKNRNFFVSAAYLF